MSIGCWDVLIKICSPKSNYEIKCFTSQLAYLNGITVSVFTWHAACSSRVVYYLSFSVPIGRLLHTFDIAGFKNEIK